MKLIGLAVGVTLALALAPGGAGATIPSCLSLKGVLHVEGDTSISGDVTKVQLERARFSNSDLLATLAEMFALVLPRGACIQVTPQDDPTPDTVALVDADGVQLQDLTGVVTVNLDTDVNLTTGSFNAVTFAESSLIIFRIEVTIVIPAEDLDFTLEGVGFQRLRAGAEQGSGLNTVRQTIKAKVAGGGTVMTFPIFIEGKVTLAGRGEFDL